MLWLWSLFEPNELDYKLRSFLSSSQGVQPENRSSPSMSDSSAKDEAGGPGDGEDRNRKQGAAEQEEGGNRKKEVSGGGSGVSVGPLQQGQVLGGVRAAPPAVHQAASAPIAIASKPVDGGAALSSLPQEKKTNVLIGGAATQLAAGGGHHLHHHHPH